MRYLAPALLLGLTFTLTGCPDDPRIVEPPGCFDCCSEFDGCLPPDFGPTQARALPSLREAETPPPPISGGTLLVAADGLTAVVGDTDRDLVDIIDLTLGATEPVVASIELSRGDEPGRVVESASGSFWVALRRGGGVVEVGADPWEVKARIETCAAPRGLAMDDAPGTLYVTCMGGDLVTVDTTSKTISSRTFLEKDLRDIVIQDDRMYISLFRAAEVIELSKAELTEVRRYSFRDSLRGTFTEAMGFVPEIAYRMTSLEGGGVMVSHQLARTQGEPIQTEVPGGYGGFGCGSPSIVQAGVTEIRVDGTQATTALGGMVLPVDVAVSGSHFALAGAGNRVDDPLFTGGGGVDFDRSTGMAAFGLRAPAVLHTARENIELSGGDASFLPCNGEGQTFGDERRATAVAFDTIGRLVILTRAPSAILVPSAGIEIALPGDDVYDAGHELFHGDAGSGIACASCHAEGGEDGQVWTFTGVGSLRTQEIRGGILGSEPFHWTGDMESFDVLAAHVFAERMGGPSLPGTYSDSLSSWIDTLTVPPHGDNVDPMAAERGRAIFESAQAGCATCHSGARLSGPGAFDVGTGGMFQVPPLAGIGLRAPYLHNGCAATLTDRFDPACGGAAHGNVSHLATEQIGDLVSYLETL